MSYRQYAQNGYNITSKQGDFQSTPKEQPTELNSQQQAEIAERARQAAERAANIREAETIEQAELARTVHEIGKRIKSLRHQAIAQSEGELKNAA